MPLRQIAEEKGRGKGLEAVGRLERIKRDSGINDREERSRGIEILMVDAFAKIKPTDPLRLAKQAARRKQNGSDSSQFISQSTCFTSFHGGKQTREHCQRKDEGQGLEY